MKFTTSVFTSSFWVLGCERGVGLLGLSGGKGKEGEGGRGTMCYACIFMCVFVCVSVREGYRKKAKCERERTTRTAVVSKSRRGCQ